MLSLHLTLRLVLDKRNNLIIGLVVWRIRLLKTLMCFQLSPEAGDRVVSVHILCSTEQLLCWHIAWQSSKESCVMTARLGCRKQGWVMCSKLSISPIPLAWLVLLTWIIPKATSPNKHWPLEFPWYQTISVETLVHLCHTSVNGVPCTVVIPCPLKDQGACAEMIPYHGEGSALLNFQCWDLPHWALCL